MDYLTKDIKEKEELIRKRESVELLELDHIQMPPLEPDQFHSQAPIEGSSDKQISDYTTQ